MLGKVKVSIQSAKIWYEFELERNITIITGNSGKGKSVLVQMVRDSRDPSIGIKIDCCKPCKAINDDNIEKLNEIEDTIIFIDEFDTNITSKKFAEYVKKSSNYFVIVTRENLYQLPYSIKSIYTINNRNKYSKTTKTYNELVPLYENHISKILDDASLIIVEDSGAGYSCFSKIFGENKCETANGNSSVFKTISKFSKIHKNIVIIVDGAAFGAYMDACYYRVLYSLNLTICAPESFEHLLLSTGKYDELVPKLKDYMSLPQISSILKEPYKYVDSKEFESWEQFFTAILISVSKQIKEDYNKGVNGDYFSDSTLFGIRKKLLEQDFYNRNFEK